MSSYRNIRRLGSYDHRSRGLEKALEHIRDAERLSQELGGTDEDVKDYFFSLSDKDMKFVLNRYEIHYGKSARQYAENTIPKWRRGKVQMSGMVAERLFKLLPPFMSLESKYRLTESLWKHVGPSSRKTYYVGINANIEDVAQVIKEHLGHVVVQYEIPNAMEKRFNWLAQGDVLIKQKLLNHFRQCEKELLSVALKSQLPVLINHIRSAKGNFLTQAAQILKVGKHEVKVLIDDKVKGITDINPDKPFKNKNISWFLLAIGIGLFILLRLLHH